MTAKPATKTIILYAKMRQCLRFESIFVLENIKLADIYVAVQHICRRNRMDLTGRLWEIPLNLNKSIQSM